MKALNQHVNRYTDLLQEGEIQEAYKGILAFMGKLRSDYSHRKAVLQVSGGLYQGYMDMTYFPLTNEILKERDLKIAIVYLHPQKTFEAWLSARNRAVIGQYRTLFTDSLIGGVEVYHDESNEDAILECVLTDAPDFDHQDALSETLLSATDAFALAIQKALLQIPSP